MKFEVRYLAIDRDDNVSHREEVVEAKDSKEVYSKIRKANKGCLLRDVRIRHSNEDADYEESPVEDRKCDKCGKLLNDMGECPVCVHGDMTALDETLTNENKKYYEDKIAEYKEKVDDYLKQLKLVRDDSDRKDIERKIAGFHNQINYFTQLLKNGGNLKMNDLELTVEESVSIPSAANKTLMEAKEAAIKARAQKDKELGVDLDPLNPDDMEAVADEHGYDDEETAIYKKHYFGEGAATVSVDKFWGLVCSGSDDEIFKICSDDRDPKQYYNRFGSDHSYIMGAIRNGNYSTAKILMTFGHKILEHESYEVVAELLKAKGIK